MTQGDKMKCFICEATDDFKLCKTTLNDGRTAYRHYCPKCGNLIGSFVKKEVAENCGYELTEQDGNTDQYTQERDYRRTMALLHEWTKTVPCKSIDEWQLVECPDHYLLSINYQLCPIHITYEIAEGWQYCYYENEDEFKCSAFPDLYYEAIPFDDFIKIRDEHNKQFIRPSFAHKIPKILLDEYKEYINSPKWQRKRQQRLALDNNECKLCFTRDNLRVHHISYDQLGDEPMKHLLTVCRECHTMIHGHETQ